MAIYSGPFDCPHSIKKYFTAYITIVAKLMCKIKVCDCNSLLFHLSTPDRMKTQERHDNKGRMYRRCERNIYIYCILNCTYIWRCLLCLQPIIVLIVKSTHWRQNCLTVPTPLWLYIYCIGRWKIKLFLATSAKSSKCFKLVGSEQLF